MAETEAQTPAAASKKKASKPRKPKTMPSHPKVSEMVNEAIENLRDRGGSSLQAIKKYVAANYDVDIDKISPFLRRYLKTAVVSGDLVQTKGKGATGSFKIGGQVTKPKDRTTKPAAKKETPEKIIKKPSPKKLKPKPAAAKKAAKKPAKAKSASKAKSAPKKSKSAAEKKAKK